MEKFIIGKTNGTHGLKGAIKVQMYYSYLEDIFNNAAIFINGKLVQIEEVFGKVKDICIVKLKAIDTIDEAKSYKNQDILALLNPDYSCSLRLIGYDVFRGEKNIGKILDVHWINGCEFIELHTEMITMDQIKLIENHSVFI